MKTSAIRLGGEFLVLCEALTPVWLFLFYWQCCDGGMEAFFCKITAASVFTLLTCTVLYRFIRMTQTKGVLSKKKCTNAAAQEILGTVIAVRRLVVIRVAMQG